MYKILIDTTDRFNRKVTLKLDENVIEDYLGPKDVIGVISEILIKHKLGINDIELIEPNTGPGSFTGIKVGVVIANVFSWAKSKLENNEPKYFEPNYGSDPHIQAK